MIKLFSFEYQSEIHFGVAECRPNDKRLKDLYQITLRDGELFILHLAGVAGRWVQLDQSDRPQELIQAIGKGLEQTGMVVPKWKIWRHYVIMFILKITS